MLGRASCPSAKSNSKNAWASGFAHSTCPYIACVLKQIPARDHLHSSNLVARLNLPNMAYALDEVLRRHAAARRVRRADQRPALSGACRSAVRPNNRERRTPVRPGRALIKIPATHRCSIPSRPGSGRINDHGPTQGLDTIPASRERSAPDPSPALILSACRFSSPPVSLYVEPTVWETP